MFKFDPIKLIFRGLDQHKKEKKKKRKRVSPKIGWILLTRGVVIKRRHINNLDYLH